MSPVCAGRKAQVVDYIDRHAEGRDARRAKRSKMVVSGRKARLLNEIIINKSKAITNERKRRNALYPTD
jgi:hypothetical protein